MADVQLTLSHHEAAMLRSMLHEQVTNDLDLLEDLVYAGKDSSEAIERIALAVMLGVSLET